jgi:hypothetical protein
MSGPLEKPLAAKLPALKKTFAFKEREIFLTDSVIILTIFKSSINCCIILPYFDSNQVILLLNLNLKLRLYKNYDRLKKYGLTSFEFKARVLIRLGYRIYFTI